MEFSSSIGDIIALLATVATFAVVAVILRYARGTRKWIALPVLIVSLGFINFSTLFLTGTYTGAERVSDIEVAKEFFDFDSGAEYPMVLPGMDAPQGKHFLMRGDKTGKMQIMFVNGSRMHPLPLSSGMIRFNQDDGAPSTMRLNLVALEAVPGLADEGMRPSATTGAYRTITDSGCLYRLVNLTLQCKLTFTASDSIVAPEGLQVYGLGALLAVGPLGGFESAEITLPHEWYTKVMTNNLPRL